MCVTQTERRRLVVRTHYYYMFVHTHTCINRIYVDKTNIYVCLSHSLFYQSCLCHSSANCNCACAIVRHLVELYIHRWKETIADQWSWDVLFIRAPRVCCFVANEQPFFSSFCWSPTVQDRITIKYFRYTKCLPNLVHSTMK